MSHSTSGVSLTPAAPPGSDAVAAGSPAAGRAIEPRLVATDLTKSYGAVQAVRGVSLTCRPGEVLALVGENGAGKSTVAKMLAGTVGPTSGTITVGGQPLASGSVRRSRALGVRCAFQELALVPDWTVAENLVLPDGSARRGFAPGRAVRVAAELLDDLGLPEIDPSALVATLPLAQRQQVEIARALAGRPRVLILDEASSALTPPGVAWLFDRIRDLTAAGGSVIYVSHRLGEIAEIADRGTVLRDGQVAGDFVRGQWTEDELITLMAGRETERFFPDPPERTHDTVALEVRNLRAAGLHGVDLALGAGEVLGVGGLAGHGQTELLRALFGAVPAVADTWRLGGDDVGRRTPVRSVRDGVGYVPEDRKLEGLALDLGVGENLVAPWTGAISLGGRPRLARERGWITGVLRSLSVRTRGPAEAAGALSGGNQQKLVFGRWLDRGCRVVLLHDPTRGIDVRAKQDLYGAITDLARSGVGVIWFSTEVEELVHVCHRVVVLYRGRVADELVGERLTADGVVGAAVGVSATGAVGPEADRATMSTEVVR